MPIIALGAIGALAVGGVAYAASRDKDGPPLPVPDEDAVCSTSADVGQATSELLADQTITANGYRKAADVLENWTTFCDDAAKQTAKSSVALLLAKAALLDAGSPVPTSPWPVPPGYVGSHHTEGLHGEMGTVYWYANKDEWFYPDNPSLIPYYIPGGNLDILTSGGCRDCEREEP